MNKKVMLIIPILIGIMFILPMLSAATMTAPVTNGNYTKSLAFDITVGANGVNNMTNTTCYYNSSGGATGTYLLQMLNSSASSTTFTGTAAALSSETRTYNVSCEIRNGTTLNSTLYANTITIDGTNPVITLTLDKDRTTVTNTIHLDWTTSDATSGLSTVVTTVTSPNTDRCATKTYTSTTGDYALTGEDTKCEGTYTALVTATDYSGNIGTSTSTFKIDSAGSSKSGSNTGLSGTAGVPVSTGNIFGTGANGGINTNTVIVLIILGICFYYILKKK